MYFNSLLLYIAQKTTNITEKKSANSKKKISQ